MASFYLFFLFLSGFFLQTSVLGYFRFYGVTPNILMILIVLATLYEDNNRTIIFAIIFGFFYDLVIRSFFGITMISFLIVFFFGKALAKGKGSKTPLTKIVVIFGVGSIISVMANAISLWFNGGEFSTKLIYIYSLQIISDIAFGMLFFILLRRFFEFIRILEEKSNKRVIG